LKNPDEVGKDFDEYVRRWEDSNYRMEKGYDGQSLTYDEKQGLQFPGDEWGELSELVDLYRGLIPRLLTGEGAINVLEIGPGGGRATTALLEVLGDRANDYHALEVSPAFAEVLRERVDRPIEVHVISRVDISALPSDHFDICLAQSSWSHIGMYDQFRYLRDLRRVLRHRAPLIVNGLFMLGVGDDWTWDRFRRRVYQVDHEVEGVYHEFNSVDGLVEQFARLEYEPVLIHNSGFIVRRMQANPNAAIANLESDLAYPYIRSIRDFALGATPEMVVRGRRQD
jgi:phospholipid N-methyltransferase